MKGDDEFNFRRAYLSRIAKMGGALVMSGAVAEETSEDAPLDFGFIRQPPGELYSIGTHRLHYYCQGEYCQGEHRQGRCSEGEAEVTVLFEPGLGGSALEWTPVVDTIKEKVRACLYDRAGYAWSDPGSNPRHVVKLAQEARQLFAKLQADSKFILVGHSYGGLIMRQLASTMPDNIVGMILVDASHEDQFSRLAGESDVSMLPTSEHFVVAAPELPSGLRSDIRRKILAFSRMRKTYAALHAEIASFRDSCNYIKQNRKTFDFPVIIISRGLDPYAEDSASGNKNRIWHELQSDFLTLSADAEQVIAENSGHHIHIDEPELIVHAIEKLVSSSVK